MNKKGLIKFVSLSTGLDKAVIDRVLNGTCDVVVDCLQKGEEINISGGFKILTKQRGERKYINFQTGESFLAPPKVIPVVKFSKKFIEKF